MPDTYTTLHEQAKTLMQTQRLHEALGVYKKLSRAFPNDAQAWHMAGAIHGMLGDFDAARICCEKAVKLLPHAHEPCLNLANVHMAAGDFLSANRSLKQALKRKPEDSAVLAKFGALRLKQKRSQSAIGYLQRAIVSAPDNFEALNLLGTAHRTLGDLDASEVRFNEALAVNPQYIDALCNLAEIYSQRLQFSQAESVYQKAQALNPDNADTLCGLGQLLHSMGRYEEAKLHLANAMRLRPDDDKPRVALAALHEHCGDQKTAMELIEPAVKSADCAADAAITFAALCRKQGRHAEAIALLEALLDSPQSKDDEINLLYALGELRDAMQDYSNAFHTFKKANTLDMEGKAGDDGSVYVDAAIAFFEQTKTSQLPRSRNTTELPIFIVGMPRSGTSLVEQILATHPDVMAGDERGDILRIIGGLQNRAGTASAYPDCLDTLSTQTLDEIAAEYIQQLPSLGENVIRFTDKTPLHGLHLGLVNMLLPGSRVIICNRNPLDTCLSIYFHRFNAFHGYAGDLAALGRFYNNYRRLLDHWLKVLDIRILELSYEELVGSSEETIRSLIDFCGLDWHPGCLEFHKTRRTVNTPSYDQVRKPLYTSSIQRWKHYAAFIGPLKSVLHD